MLVDGVINPTGPVGALFGNTNEFFRSRRVLFLHFLYHPNKDFPSCYSLIIYSSKYPAASNNAMTTPISITVGLMRDFRLTLLIRLYVM